LLLRPFSDVARRGALPQWGPKLRLLTAWVVRFAPRGGSIIEERARCGVTKKRTSQVTDCAAE
jgi:hypothetical protein